MLSRYQRIASYIDVANEFPTARINQTIIEHGLKLSFPVITNYHTASMRFVPWQIRTKFEINRYAIPEPLGTIQQLELIKPDLILMPLLGFDAEGNRIGMGGGYYDRYLANLPGKQKPRLIGLAFNNQRVDTIKSEAYDIPINGILTESRLEIF